MKRNTKTSTSQKITTDTAFTYESVVADVFNYTHNGLGNRNLDIYSVVGSDGTVFTGFDFKSDAKKIRNRLNAVTSTVKWRVARGKDHARGSTVEA